MLKPNSPGASICVAVNTSAGLPTCPIRGPALSLASADSSSLFVNTLGGSRQCLKYLDPFYPHERLAWSAWHLSNWELNRKWELSLSPFSLPLLGTPSPSASRKKNIDIDIAASVPMLASITGCPRSIKERQECWDWGSFYTYLTDRGTEA